MFWRWAALGWLYDYCAFGTAASIWCARFLLSLTESTEAWWQRWSHQECGRFNQGLFLTLCFILVSFPFTDYHFRFVAFKKNGWENSQVPDPEWWNYCHTGQVFEIWWWRKYTGGTCSLFPTSHSSVFGQQLEKTCDLLETMDSCNTFWN